MVIKPRYNWVGVYFNLAD